MQQIASPTYGGNFSKSTEKKRFQGPKKNSNSKGATEPDPFNLIQFDTLSFSKFSVLNYILAGFLLRFIFDIISLLTLLGWQSAFFGMIVTVICGFVYLFVINQ